LKLPLVTVVRIAEVAHFKGDFQQMSVRAFSEMTSYSALAWEKLGQRTEAKEPRINKCRIQGLI
jgi:hypothetical protein